MKVPFKLRLNELFFLTIYPNNWDKKVGKKAKLLKDVSEEEMNNCVISIQNGEFFTTETSNRKKLAFAKTPELAIKKIITEIYPEFNFKKSLVEFSKINPPFPKD